MPHRCTNRLLYLMVRAGLIVWMQSHLYIEDKVLKMIYG